MKWFIHPVFTFPAEGEKVNALQKTAMLLDNHIIEGPEPLTIRSLTDAIADAAARLESVKADVQCVYDGHYGMIIVRPEGAATDTPDIAHICFNRIEGYMTLGLALGFVKGGEL